MAFNIYDESNMNNLNIGSEISETRRNKTTPSVAEDGRENVALKERLLTVDSGEGKLREELREARDLNSFFGRALESLENLIAEYNYEEDAFSRRAPDPNDSYNPENIATRMLKSLEETRKRFAYIERKLSSANDNALNLEKRK